MSLVSQVNTLSSRVAQEINTLRSQIGSGGGGGAVDPNIVANVNSLLMRQADDDFKSGRSALDVKGGVYDIFGDQSKIHTVTDAQIITLGDGDTNGIARIADTAVGTSPATTFYWDPAQKFLVYPTLPIGGTSGMAVNAAGTEILFVQYSSPQLVGVLQLGTANDLTSGITGIDYSATMSGIYYPTACGIMPDGNHMFTIGHGDFCRFYSLTTPDLFSTADISTYTQVTLRDEAGGPFNLNTNDGLDSGIYVDPTGTHMVAQRNGFGEGRQLYRYTFGTPNTPSTLGANATQTRNFPSISNKDGGFVISPNGHWLYIVDPYKIDDVWWYKYEAYYMEMICDIENAQRVPLMDQYIPTGQHKHSTFRTITSNGSYHYSIGGNEWISRIDAIQGGGYEPSATIRIADIDLTTDLTANPTEVFVSVDGFIPTNTEITLSLDDGTTTHVITSSQFDSFVALPFNARTMQATFTLTSTDSELSPILDKYVIYFK